MLTQNQAEVLAKQLEDLRCTDPKSGDGLFTYVFKGEPQDQAHRYTEHISHCDYCRIALEIYRYKRDVAKVLGQRSDTEASNF